MTIVLVSIFIFFVTLGAALLGLYVHKLLPAEQKSDSARNIVGQVSGLVSLLLALVLGTLVGASFAFFSTQKAELEALSAQFVEFDQAMPQYGPETKPARDRLKQAGTACL
jgi:ABC-type dipeptide/oligopeptide/nickel transport system permease component